jgi:Tfp pilus assembly protein PilF
MTNRISFLVLSIFFNLNFTCPSRRIELCDANPDSWKKTMVQRFKGNELFVANQILRSIIRHRVLQTKRPLRGEFGDEDNCIQSFDDVENKASEMEQEPLSLSQVSGVMKEIQDNLRLHLTETMPQYLQMALDHLFDRKPMNTKDRTFIEAIKADPTDLKQLESYADWLTDHMYEIDQAEEVYNYALLVAPTSGHLKYRRAELLSEVRGRHAEAELAYRAALLLDPAHCGALVGYGRLLLDVFDDVAGASARLDCAVRAHPGRVEALSERARAYEAAGDTAAAERTYRLALRAGPGDAQALNNYAGLLIQLDRAGEALETLMRGVRSSGRAAAVVYNYGMALERMGETERAEQAYREVLEKGGERIMDAMPTFAMATRCSKRRSLRGVITDMAHGHR